MPRPGMTFPAMFGKQVIKTKQIHWNGYFYNNSPIQLARFNTGVVLDVGFCFFLSSLIDTDWHRSMGDGRRDVCRTWLEL